MHRLLSNHWFQAIALPALLALGAWVGNYLWGQIDNAPVQAQVDELKTKAAATDAAAVDLKDDVHYIRDRVDAIYDRLPDPRK